MTPTKPTPPPPPSPAVLAEALAARRIEKRDLAIAQLRARVEEFIAHACTETPAARLKMLETSIEIDPLMQKIVKAVTGKK